MTFFKNPHGFNQNNHMHTSQPNNAYINQPNIVMTPNGPMQYIMTPNGPMLVPVQNAFQPMAGMVNNTSMFMNQQPYFAPNIYQHVQTNNRFQNDYGQGYNHLQGAINNARISEPMPNNQFHQPNNMPNNQFYQENSQVDLRKKFVVNLRNPKKLENCEFTYGTHISEIKPNAVSRLNENHVGIDCFNDTIEYILENYHKKDNMPLLVYQDFIVNNIFYKPTMAIKLIDILKEGDIKVIYKAIKNIIFKEISNSYDYYAINGFDRIITTYVNDFLGVGLFEYDASIDSFIEDFNDLLKVIRNNTESTEDELIDYLNSKINDINKSYELLKNEDEDFNNNKNLIICEKVDMVYVNKLDIELGIENLGKKFVIVDKFPPNNFIISLSNVINDKYKLNEFYLVTLNRKIIKFFKYNDYLFIKLVS